MLKAALVIASLVCTAPGTASVPPPEPARTPGLHPALEPIAFFLGSYEIDATWSFGGELEAKAFYTPGPGGRFIVMDIYPSDDGGPYYHRYHGVIAFDPSTQTMTSYDFAFDGTLNISTITLGTDDNGQTTAESVWPNGMVRETLTQHADGSIGWKAWMRAQQRERDDQTPTWQLVMDDAWAPAPDIERPASPPAELVGKIAEFTPYLGVWALDAGGFQSRQTYRPGVAGRTMVIDAEAKNGRGEMQPAYTTHIAWDEAKEAYTAYSFLPNGVVRVMPIEVDRDADGAPRRVSMGWEQQNGPQTVYFRQSFTVPGDETDAYGWKLFIRERNERDWTERMNGRWQRETPPRQANDPEPDTDRGGD